MIGARESPPRWLLPVWSLVAAALFLLDLATPLGVADGILYAALQLLGLWARRPRLHIVITLLAAALVLGGAALHPGGTLALGLLNRGFTLVAIAFIGALLYMFQSSTIEHAHAERLAETYLDMTGTAFVAVDRAGRVTQVNRSACLLLGADAARIVGRAWFEAFVPPRDRTRSREEFQKLMAGDVEVVERFESAILDAAGRERLVSWHHGLLRRADGTVGGLLSSGEDVTERRAMEQELHRSRELLEEAQRIAHLGSYELSASGEDYWSEEVYRIAGLDPGASGLTRERYLDEIVHPEDRPRLVDARARAFEEGAAIRLEYRVRRPDGSIRHVLSVSEPERGPDGRVHRLVGTLLDVTERRRAEDALRESIRQLEDLKFAIDQAAIVDISDPDGTITFANDQFCNISKYPREELLGRNHRITNSGLHSREFFQDLWETIGAGNVWRGEIRNRTRDGAHYWVDTTIVPFLDDAGRPKQYLSIRGDITQRKHAEEELHRQAALAHLGRMAAVVAHEVKNPLAGISGAIAIIGQRLPLDSPDRKVIGHIMERIEGLDGMVQDLLLFARPRPPRLSSVELVSLLRDAAVPATQDPQHEGLRVEVTGTPLRLRADAELLKEAVLNLLLNGAHAMGGRGVLRVAVRVEGSEAVIDIVDEGAGIPTENLPRVFEPFFTTKHRGTGLGLPIARRVVEAHGGHVDLQSQVGRGTKVTLRLPLSPREPPAGSVGTPGSAFFP